MEKPKLKREVYVDDENEALGVEIQNDLNRRVFEIQEDRPLVRLKEVPNLKLFDVQVDGITEKVQEIKLSNKSIEFINIIQAFFDLFDKTENKYNEKIVLFAMQAIENLFINKKKIGPLKLICIIEACSKYFNNDEQLITKFVD